MNNQTVWVLNIDNKYGVATTLWHVEEDALKALFEYVSQHWERWFGKEDDPDLDPEDKIPEDHREAIDRYFNEVDEESYSLDLCKIN